MAGKRKNIGVFVSGNDGQLHGTIIQGIKERARELDCNVVIFHSLATKLRFNQTEKIEQSVIRGESSVLFGHEIDVFDALIIMGESFLNDDIKKELVKRATDKGIPVIDVDDSEDECSCVRYDDTSGMELVVRHIVEHHGCKKVNFISGFKGNRQSEERIKAYIKVLEENNIPVEPKRIGYGEFYIKAVEVIKDMVEADGVPEAVVCANDIMAIEVIAYLNSIGVRVPDDCLVAGFDGIREGQVYIPSLTTCRRAIKYSGVKALDIAVLAADGEKTEKLIYLEPELVLGQSCGCVENNELGFNSFYKTMNNMVNDRDLFNSYHIDMMRDFASVKQIDDIFGIMFKYLGSFRFSWFDYYVNKDVINFNESEMRDSIDQVAGRDIYSNELVCYSWRENEKGYQCYEVKTKSLLRNMFDNAGDEPVFITLVPSYYQNMVLGFAAVDETKCIHELAMLCALMATVSYTIGDFCMRREMRNLINKLDSMYVSDNLTGLHNRFGLYRDAGRMLLRAKEKGKKVIAVAIDLDRLKFVNDNFGHEEGDNAIKTIAKAMKYAAGNRKAVLSRTGGDEYFMMDFCEDDSAGEQFVEKIYAYLSDYNLDRGLPYVVECSCGFYVADPKVESLEGIMRVADERMYEVKMARKAARNNRG